MQIRTTGVQNLLVLTVFALPFAPTRSAAFQPCCGAYECPGGQNAAECLSAGFFCLNDYNSRGYCACRDGYDLQRSCQTCTVGTVSRMGDPKCSSCPILDPFRGEYRTGAFSTCDQARQCQSGYNQFSHLCEQCNPGTYSGGASACVPCPVLSGGFYKCCPQATQQGCSECTENDKYVMMSSFDCAAAASCHAGYAGASCARCANGRYSTGGPASTCSACPALTNGEYTNFGIEQTCAATTRRCDAGYGGATCEQCATGFYSDGTGTLCIECPALAAGGRYATGAVLTSEADCAAAKECLPGYGGADCTQCGTGEFSLGGSNPCQQCPALGLGSYSAPTSPVTSAEACSYWRSCYAGYGTATCSLCPRGQYSTGGTASCVACPQLGGGTYLLGPITSYRQCASRANCNAGYGPGRCWRCAYGQWSPAGTSPCRNCPALTWGSWVASALLGSPADCDAARRCQAGWGYTTGAGAQTKHCEWCPLGHYSAQGAQSCSACPALLHGDYRKLNANGYYHTLGSEADCQNAKQCYRGSNALSATCELCPAGKYAPTSFSDTYTSYGCYSCGAATSVVYWTPANSQSGYDSCNHQKQCHAGYYKKWYWSGSSWYTSCDSCWAQYGHYSTGGFQRNCGACPALESGTYQGWVRLTSPEQCPGARSCNAGAGGNTCQVCPSGNYSAGGKEPCRSCPDLGSRGSYSQGGITSATACTVAQSCEAGYGPETEDASWTGCLQCAIGQYSTAGSGCMQCPNLGTRGHYLDILMTSVAACDAARVCNAGTDGSSPSCETCSPGEWSDGSGPCQPCSTLSGPGSSYTGPSTDASCAGERNCAPAHNGESATCGICAVGEYSTGGLSACAPCPTLEMGGGSYLAVGTEATCSSAGVRSCLPGYDGQSDTCDPCATSTYSLGGDGACLPCPTLQAGGYTGPDTEASCSSARSCPPATDGAGDCGPCATSTFSTGGTSACQPCTPLVAGSYTGAGVDSTCATVRSCAAGHDGATENCASCNTGMFSAGGLAPCESCPALVAGAYTGAGEDATCESVRNCPPGHDGASETCAPCTVGSYSEGGIAPCLPCPTLVAGSFTGPGTEPTCATVRDCDSGHDGESETCEACGTGNFSTGGKAPCASCPALEGGQHTGPGVESTCADVRVCDAGHDGTSSTCARCPFDGATGSWSPGGLAGCEACATLEGGHYNGSGTDASCVDVRECDPGFDGASPSCAACDDGFFSDGGASPCEACPVLVAGEYTGPSGDASCRSVRSCEAAHDGDSETCQRCPAGNWSAGGLHPCLDCVALEGGVYSGPAIDENCSDVKECFEGTDGSSATCASCLPGQYSTGAEACQDCPGLEGAGSMYVKATLAREEECAGARSCEAGFGGATCQRCAAQTYSLGGLEADCMPCGAAADGWVFLGRTGLTSLADCGADQACAAGHGGDACEICVTGSFSAGGAAGDRTPACTTCGEEGAAKPPNAEYLNDGSEASKQAASTQACAYECTGEYAMGSQGACDKHPMCLEGQFYNDAAWTSAGASNGSCWEFQAGRRTFVEARLHCNFLGGEMVSIYSAEDAAVFELAQRTFAWVSDTAQPAAFIGMTDSLSEGGWYHIDGSKLSASDFANWAPGEPSASTVQNGEDCAIVVADGTWFDIPCDSMQPSVCLVPVAPEPAKACDEAEGAQCHYSAHCTVDNTEAVCSCEEGFWGDGMSECSPQGYALRFNLFLPVDTVVLQPDGSSGTGKLRFFNSYREQFASLLTPDGFRTGGDDSSRRSLPPNFLSSMQHSVTDLSDASQGYLLLGAPTGTKYMLTVNAIFGERDDADAALAELLINLEGNHSFAGAAQYPEGFGVSLLPEQYPTLPRVYRWVAQTTSAGLQIAPTGMTVESVRFQPDCEESGCWVVELLFTTGTDTFNTFFIPQAVGDDSIDHDFFYGSPDATWGVSPLDTFMASTFPCGSADYDPTASNPLAPSAPPAVTSCCLPEFMGMYRPIDSFVTEITGGGVTKEACDEGIVNVFSRPGWSPPPPPGPSPYVGHIVDCATALNLGTAPVEIGADTECYTPGGASGQISHAYAAGDNMAWVLAAQPGSAAMEVVFRFFSTIADTDWVRIYECDSATCSASTLLAQGSGAYNEFSVTSCSGFLMITLDSNATSPGAQGFMADFYELPVCPYGAGVSGKSLRSPGDGTAADENRVEESRRHLLPKPSNHLYGNFKGMSHSYVAFKSVEDPYIGQYRATAFFDEVELRRNGGLLRGTVGVEHTVDTFIGLANFKPTGIEFLDPFATQVALHLEKTSFFTVSTHGVNDYTFLEYINLRLIAVYREDTDPTESIAEQAQRTNRTSPAAAAQYIQVTFTMGAQYQPIETGLVPLDSVRVAQGDFFDSAAFEHLCAQYAADDGSFDGGNQALFDSRFPWDSADAGGATNQQCAPNARMCVNPVSVPDAFVAFNIPLGIDWLPEPQGDLSANVFVDLVISAIDNAQIDNSLAAPSPNDGAPAEQMKTTLSASIPVVRGGINIFCDQITAKTDLKDVVNADIVFGSAGVSSELSRLSFLKDIASTNLDAVPSQAFQTDSIEAGLMTLVVKGNASYFSLGGTGGYGVQVEDVVTIHIMEATDGRVGGLPADCMVGVDAGCSTPGNMLDQAMDLVEQPGDDNNMANGLVTDGYSLNGGFDMVVDRARNRAYLEPSRALLALCPFNPPRPSAGEPFPTTCVLRRDIQRQGFPFRVGGFSTAVELPAEAVGGESLPSSGREQVGRFMQSLLGESHYAYELGQNYSLAVAQMYSLNSRYNRAFFINPGYEWTPAQTGGQSAFSISQKIIFFALINLDEGLDPAASNAFDASDGCNYRLPGDPADSFGSGCAQRRHSSSVGRRLLLSGSAAAAEETGSGVGAAQVSFKVSPQEQLAKSLGIAAESLAVVRVQMQLSAQQACGSAAALRADMQQTLAEHLAQSATALHRVAVMSVALSLNGVSCRRSLSLLRRNSAVFSAATASVELAVAFQQGSAQGIDTDTLRSFPGVLAVHTLVAAPAIQIDDDFNPDSLGHGFGNWAARTPEPDASSSGNVVLIASAVAGGAVLLLAIAGVALWVRRARARAARHEIAALTNTPDVESLKRQLALEVVGVPSPQLVFAGDAVNSHTKTSH